MGSAEGVPPTRSSSSSPHGFLVLIFDGTDEAGEAGRALRDGGFLDADLRIYASEQILADHDRYRAQRAPTDPVGPPADDRGAIELYFGYARQGRAALWVRVPDRADASRALRYLADDRALDLRFYGHYSPEDIHSG